MATDWGSLCSMPAPASMGGGDAGAGGGDRGATICENNAVILTGNSAEAIHMVSRTLSDLPAVTAANGGVLGTETTKSLKRKSTSGGGNSGGAGSSSGAKTAKWAFLPPRHMAAGGPPAALAKLFWTMLSGEGLTQAVTELITCTSANTSTATDYYQKLQSRAIHFSAKAFLTAYNFITLNIYGTIRPGITMSAEELTEKFHPTRDWSSSSVRVLAWHPHTNKVAVATRDDAVHIYTAPPTSKDNPYWDKSAPPFVPVLKYKQQRGVTTMAWRPFYASELAVGCSSGVLVWTIDPTSTVARPSAGCVSLLQSQGHSPVNHVSWQPNGELLLSVSAVDSSIILWNTASETGEVLRRVGVLGAGHSASGFHSAQFSPDGRALFAAHATAQVFRMWSTSNWTQESWRVTGGSVQTACWSRDSSTLLYTVTNDSKVFCIKFRPDVVTAAGSDEDDVKTAGAAVPVIDLQEVTFTNDVTGEQVTTGGLVQAMRWDTERLVVSFVDSNLLAVFQTEVSPANIAVSPLGFVCGQSETEWPSCFEFAPHFAQQGALLTIAWNSGRVQHFPMYYTPRHCLFADTSFTHHQHYNQGGLTARQQLSTSHLQNNQSIGAVTDFEPQLFSGPAPLT